MAQVQIGFGTVVGDEDLAVLVGRQRPWIHVDVGIEFLQRHPVAALLQKPGQRSG